MKLFITNNWPPDYRLGGVVYSGYHLFHSLKSVDDSWICITTSSVRSTERDVFTFKFLGSGKHGVSLGLLIFLSKNIYKKAVTQVFINGTVTLPNIFAQFLCVLLSKKYIVSTRGALEPWRMKHKKIQKYVYFRLVVIPLLKRANWIHVTGQLERDYVFRWVPNRRILVFPNGISSTGVISNTNSGKIKLLFLSRISPEKGIDILLGIVNEIREYKLNIELTIIGPNADKTFTDAENIRVINGVYGCEKIKYFQECDLFILPSYSENFGNVILESLSHGRAVITTTKTPWNELCEFNCGWQIQPSLSEFINLLKNIQFIDRKALVQMGENGELLAKNYIWENLAKKFNEEIDAV